MKKGCRLAVSSVGCTGHAPGLPQQVGANANAGGGGGQIKRPCSSPRKMSRHFRMIGVGVF
jgi:hypothetical protein